LKIITERNAAIKIRVVATLFHPADYVGDICSTNKLFTHVEYKKYNTRNSKTNTVSQTAYIPLCGISICAAMDTSYAGKI
jgi:hypothetical protein